MEGKIWGGIFGLCVGDAVGVPVEFCSRESLASSPVTDMCGCDTYHQPPGTWSDDTSMTLCLLDSLSNGLDYADIMKKFLSWLEEASYTPFNEVFDVGKTSREAITRFAKGVLPLQCGGGSEYDNGNGALMRILPLIFYLHCRYGEDIFKHEEAVAIIHNTAALTHAHKRSQIACGIYLSVAEKLLRGMSLPYAVDLGLACAREYYSRNIEYADELRHYERIFAPDFADTPEDEIHSSGYVVDTLEAALWCLLTTKNYEECILKAVNLGEDTDTTAAVAGGLAGMYYGCEAIPTRWMKQIARAEYIASLCTAFENSLNKLGFEKIRPYISYFEREDLGSACKWEGGKKLKDGSITMPYPVYEEKFIQFTEDFYKSGIVDYDYGKTLREYDLEMNHRMIEKIDTADLKLTKAILTCYIQQERFCDGLWGWAIKEGVFLALLKRINALLKT